ncbi:hypothetical protein RYX56_00790 [Alkalihalophilus lindianensis]|uniref:Uncharacterized protein n=1 Tax=Alkalihalophilus lindianensis TaxID=1630542 RepID=A0ABU3X4S6_9BACI|nr:hypothetical protein [Alkalihalophilus lindianensis]MDV2682901.1 hypothetical protein [Alkalihalophilus lindianensis]
MYSEQIDVDQVNREGVDVHLIIKSPKAAISLVDAKVWFEVDGALIKMGEADYRRINHVDAEVLKRMINYVKVISKE